MLFRLSAVAFALCAAALFAGCSDSHDGRVEITGTVKLNGNPIRDGAMVEFVPLETQGTGGTVQTAGGAFHFPREGGMKPGKYLIRISLGDGKTAVNPVDENNPPGPTGSTNIVSKELVPRSWNVDSKQERTVTKEGPNNFEFVIP